MNDHSISIKVQPRVQAWFGRHVGHCNESNGLGMHTHQHPSSPHHYTDRCLVLELAMSAAAKLTLATTTLSALGIVVFVHQQQKADKAVCFQLIFLTSHYLLLIMATGNAPRRHPRHGTATH